MAMEVGELEKTVVPPVNRIRMSRPGDWHRHLRQGQDILRHLVRESLLFEHVLVMPNTKPALTTGPAVLAYREEIQNAIPEGREQPISIWMTQYLTDNTLPQDVRFAKDTGFVLAFKYYPAGATTNSDSGVTALERAYPALAAMEREDVVLSVHGEVTDAGVDVYDRERIFVERYATQIVRDFPGLRIVLEHITTSEAASFVRESGPNVAATITPQHARYSRNALLVGGIRPHWYCLPVLKREAHRQALVTAATSGNPKFFMGTDSAPHERGDKEAACGCAGCYTTDRTALALYAEVFEEAGALDKLGGFTSIHGADFYRVPRGLESITLQRAPFKVPSWYPLGANGTVVPLCAGKTLQWRVEA